MTDEYKHDNELWADINKAVKKAKFEEACRMMKLRNKKRNDEASRERRKNIKRKKKYSDDLVKMVRALHIARKEIKGSALKYHHIWQIAEKMHKREGKDTRVSMDFVKKAATLKGYREDCIPCSVQVATAKKLLQQILGSIDKDDLRYRAEQKTGLKDYYAPSKPTELYSVDENGNKQYPNQPDKTNNISSLKDKLNRLK